MDYTIFYKESFENGFVDECSTQYDYFFSGYDNCDRTKMTFGKVNAHKSIWINFPHYNEQIVEGDYYNCQSFKEDEAFIDLFRNTNLNANSKVCIDITGFIKPHLLFFVAILYKQVGIKEIDFIYSEPNYYNRAEDTEFSGDVEDVLLVEGCSSPINNPNTENDLLIISAGYDTGLISKVSNNKDKIKNKYYILGLPSLQADMYQECILKIHSAKDSLGNINKCYSPAFDPFVTAQTIHNIVFNPNFKYSNIYLSPLSTKPQALGMLLFYLWNFEQNPVNIIFPFSQSYSGNTAIGIKKTWKYTLEFP